MDHKRLLRLIGLTLCLLAVLATASACGSGGTGSLAVQPGEWEGTGDQGFKINFTVAQTGDALTFYGFFYPLACTKPGGFESVVSESNVPLGGGQFELSGTKFHVTAKFVAPERAEGAWTVKAHRSPQFGDCRETNGTWVARPKGANATPPTFTKVPNSAQPISSHTWRLLVKAAYWKQQSGAIEAKPGYKILLVIMDLEYIGQEADLQAQTFSVKDEQDRQFTIVSSIGVGEVAPEGGAEWLQSYISDKPQTRHFRPGEAFRPLVLTFVGPEDAEGMKFQFADLAPVDLTSVIQDSE